MDRHRDYDEGYHDRDRHERDEWRSNRHSKRNKDEGRFQNSKGPVWSWASTGVSIVSMTLFVSWFGIMGLLFSGLSYTDHKVGDYKRSRYKRWWAWCCAISGIIITAVSISLLMMVMFWFDVPKPTFRHFRYWVPYWLYDNLSGNSTAS